MYFKDAFVRTAKNVLIRWPQRVGRSFSFIGDYYRFKRKAGAENQPRFGDLYPRLSDKLSSTPFDHHYIYHPAWAARKLNQIRPVRHVDISSILSFSTIVSAFIPVDFYDYRPAELGLGQLQSGFADLKQLPFPDSSISSLSCMHTIEHIGLGRYGDELDPAGDLKAISELIRVLAPGGNLLFVTPVGRPRIEFNAHRIYSYERVIELFSILQLKEFSMVPDSGGFLEQADASLVKEQHYGCGCFWFSKPEEGNP